MSTPKKKKLTSETIASAALRIADESGIDAVSMRSTAASLGVQAMSLYNHVKNKDTLLDAMVETVVAEITLPDKSTYWPNFIHGRCESAYQVLKRHPWASQLFLSRMNTGPNMLHYVDATIGALVSAGFTYPQADHAWNAIDNHLYGFVLQEQHFPLEPEAYAQAAASYLPQLQEMNLPHLLHMTTLVAEKKYDGLHEFTFGLDIIIAGLEKVLKPKRKRANKRTKP